MRAKACTRCRQLKLGCDADKMAPSACSRCRSLGHPCTFDPTFQRTSKAQQLHELQQEVYRLQKALSQAKYSSATAGSSIHSHLPHGPNTATNLLQVPELSRCKTPDKVLGDLNLSEIEVIELFGVFFGRCRIYLPFKINGSSEVLYRSCPLLFWAICAVPAPPAIRSKLEPQLKRLVSDVLLEPPGSVEIVQALLILCMWPLSFSWNRHDSSLIYSGIAIHMGLQLGLHRPALASEFCLDVEHLQAEPDNETKKTTWLACYIVSQMQVARCGLPLPFPEDSNLVIAFDDPKVSPELSLLCHIYRLLGQSANVIGAKGPSVSGLADPITRVNMVMQFRHQFCTLWKRLLPYKSNMLELGFLSARLQLWSFVLHDDVLSSAEVFDIINDAEQDAMRLLQISCETNLSFVPFYVRRSICYAALMLVKLLRYPCIRSAHETIWDQIELARVSLSSSVGPNDGDIHHGIDRLLQAAPYLETMDMGPPTQSRMTYSMVFDFIRSYRRHCCPPDSGTLPTSELEIFGIEHGIGPVEWSDIDPF